MSFTEGKLLVNYILALLVLIWFIGLIIGVILNHLRLGFDDSDDKENAKRSKLTIYTDYKTGVQYVGTSIGLTPRLYPNKSLVVKNLKGTNNESIN